MKKVITLFLFLIVVFSLCGCESREMKVAKENMSIKEWKAALENLQQELKNNPKNVEAYLLVIEAANHKYFSQYNQDDFLVPGRVDSKSFPDLNEEGAALVFQAMDKIGLIDPEKITPEMLFFRGIYRISEWYRPMRDIMDSGELTSESLDLMDRHSAERCDNDLYLEAKRSFKQCADLNSQISDSAFLWLQDFRCEGDLDTMEFVRVFREKFAESDLNYHVDLIELRYKLQTLVNEFKENPGADSAVEPLALIEAFRTKHPAADMKEARVAASLVDSVEYANREYVSGTGGHVYKNGPGYSEYLDSLTKPDIEDSIRIEALLSLMKFYDDGGLQEKTIETCEALIASTNDSETVDQVYRMLGSIYENTEHAKALGYLRQIKSPGDWDRYEMWQCHVALGNLGKEEELRLELENSKDDALRFLVETSVRERVRERVVMEDLDAEFNNSSITVSGTIKNKLDVPIYNVVVVARVTDDGDKTIERGRDSILKILPSEKVRFDISIYYGSRRPDKIRYGAEIESFTK